MIAIALLGLAVAVLVGVVTRRDVGANAAPGGLKALGTSRPARPKRGAAAKKRAAPQRRRVK